jgi:hypothetical protein
LRVADCVASCNSRRVWMYSTNAGLAASGRYCEKSKAGDVIVSVRGYAAPGSF